MRFPFLHLGLKIESAPSAVVKWQMYWTFLMRLSGKYNLIKRIIRFGIAWSIGAVGYFVPIYPLPSIRRVFYVWPGLIHFHQIG